MEIKTIEQIKEEVARDYDFSNYSDLIFSLRDDCEHEPAIDAIALQYAEQFKEMHYESQNKVLAIRERVKELEGLLSGSATIIRNLGFISTRQALDYVNEIESLINKDKDNGI